MDKLKNFKLAATFFVAILLLSASAGKFNIKHPFIEKLKEQLFHFNEHYSEEKVYLQLDRNFYEPNDFVWFSAWIRNASSLRADDVSEKLYVELINPKGTVIEKQSINAPAGLANGALKISTNIGGIYKIKAYTKWQKNTKTFFEKEIQVQKVVLPNLKMKLDFDRKAYGPGDEVIANLEAKDLEDEVLRLHNFTFIVSLNGSPLSKEKSQMDFNGEAAIKFKLPKKLDTNDGLLQVLIKHKGQTESISRAIPITLKDIDLQFFPEGGNIIAGLPTKIAFKALNEFGKPADVEGVILNKKGEEVADFKSFHMGMGASKIWPERGNQYTAKITKPEGIKTVYKLPEVKLRGLNLNLDSQHQNSLNVKVQATRPQAFHLVAQNNEKIHFSKSSVVDKETIIQIPTTDFPMGITRLSLFDEEGSIACERLVFVNPHKQLHIDIKSNKKQYEPREKVKIDITVKDHLGQPVVGNFAISVADDKLLTFADDKQGHILSKLFLESELKGKIEEPDFYFDKEEEKSSLALNYLMMTQGWRRYDWKKVQSNQLMAFDNTKEKTWVAGRVVDGQNKAVANAQISIIDEELKTTSDEQGYFIIEDLKIEDVSKIMKVKSNGLPTVRKNIIEYKRDYHIVMAEGAGTISGLILLPNDRPAKRTKVEIYNDNGSKWTSTTDKKGEYAFQQLAPGSYTLNFKSGNLPGYQIEKVMVWPNEHLLLSRQLYPVGTDPSTTIENMATALTETKTNNFLIKKKALKIQQDLKRTVAKKQSEVMAMFDQQINQGGGGSINLDEICVTEYLVPLIEHDNTTQGAMVTSNDIRKFASKNITSLAAATAGMSQVDEGDGLHMRGARSNATDIYVDGIRVRASSMQGIDIEQLQVITGGVPAAYGGGVSEITEARFKYQGKNKSIPTPYHFRKPGSLAGSASNINISGGGGSVSYRGPSRSSKNHKKKSIVRRPSRIHSVVEKQARLVSKNCDKQATEEDCYNCANDLLKEKLLDAIAQTKNWNTYGADLLLEFFVTKEGEVGGIQVKGSRYNYYLNREFNKIFKQLKKWEPARINNKKVAARIVIPLSNGEMITKRNTNFQKTLEFYAPKYRSNESVQERNDFRATTFWKPDVQTNEKGKATVTFWNSDNITSFKARVEGLSTNGMVGEATQTYSVKMPFSMSAKMPIILLEGDEVRVPISLHNNTNKALNGKLEINVPASLILNGEKQLSYLLSANESKTIYPTFKVETKKADKKIKRTAVRFAFSAGKFKDIFSQKVYFQSDGFPINKLLTGTEQNNKFTIDIKEHRSGSIRTKLVAHTNIAGDIMATSERMLRQPSGCFEQTSSSNYPNVLVSQYLKKYKEQPDNNLLKKANNFLDSGYKRLTSYEVNGGGYDWFGRAPAHEALTAYGILQFTDMSSVYPVEKAMVKRTAEWLLSKKDGKGAWLPGKRGLHSWSPNDDIRNAYINWALAEAGYTKEIKKERNLSYQSALKSEDPYVLALVANTLLISGDNGANKLMAKLQAKQKKDGSFQGTSCSITNSKGKNLTLETTALAAMAFMQFEKELSPTVKSAIKYISNSKSNYGFGSTQSTVLCIKALLAFTEKSTPSVKEGNMKLYVNGTLIEQIPYSTKISKTILFKDFSHLLKEGTHDIEVIFDNNGKPIPFELAVDYASKIPEATAKKCKIGIETVLSETEVSQGETTRLTTILKNQTNEVVTSPIAIVGIPAGLSPQPWQLKKLQEEKAFAYYEIIDNKVVFYLTEMAPNGEKKIHLDLKADVPGFYLGPASCAYLYYENDVMAWVNPATVEVSP